jgi:small subunit ribosomal protein S7
MSRKRKDHSRKILPDTKFNELILAKFTNCLMWHGKRSVAERIVYGALDSIEQRHSKPGIDVFREAIDNVRPLVEVRSRRVGGATYQVPTEVRQSRRDTLAIRWLIQNSRARGEKSMRERLAGELFDASQNRGNAVKKKEDTHKMAEANRAFAHYRW